MPISRSLIARAATAGLCAILAACGARDRGASTTSTTSTTPTSRGVLSSLGDAFGVVDAGPTCPVQRAGQSCPPRPLSAKVSARDDAGRTVAATRTDAVGGYRLTMAPGAYTLVVDSGSPFPVCKPVDVSITPGGRTRADVHCDTGIR
jgi:hypothetical protein